MCVCVCVCVCCKFVVGESALVCDYCVVVPGECFVGVIVMFIRTRLNFVGGLCTLNFHCSH